ncbi:MAG: putative comF family protein [Dehalococcoidia bacterium]|nr:putative comF family protein [Dehalococcoidia bacterium]
MLSPHCPGCGRTVTEGGLCVRCRERVPVLDGRRSPFRFEGVIRSAVISFKYRGLRALAPSLAQLLQVYLSGSLLPVDILVPVPLHKRRLRERGYNQAALLARELGKLSSLPVGEQALLRQRQALPQARTATIAERYRNVSGAFLCSGDGVRGKKVLLIDDVSTSGATLEACAVALKSAGAVSVWGLVLAQEI